MNDFIYEVSKYHPMNLVLKMNENKDVLVVDNESSHTILKNKRYFINLTLKNANISTIAGIASLIEGHGEANILLPMGTHLEI